MFFNLIAVLISDYLIGGNASNGKIENGIYYVMSSEGEYFQVSIFAFMVSYGFSILTVLFVVIGFISIFILYLNITNSEFFNGQKK